MNTSRPYQTQRFRVSTAHQSNTKSLSAALSFKRQANWVAPRYLTAEEVRDVVRRAVKFGH